jgi:hypothetical protein
MWEENKACRLEPTTLASAKNGLAAVSSLEQYRALSANGFGPPIIRDRAGSLEPSNLHPR